MLKTSLGGAFSPVPLLTIPLFSSICRVIILIHSVLRFNLLLVIILNKYKEKGYKTSFQLQHKHRLKAAILCHSDYFFPTLFCMFDGAATYQRKRMIFFLLRLAYFTKPNSIHLLAKDRTLFFFMAKWNSTVDILQCLYPVIH